MEVGSERACDLLANWPTHAHAPHSSASQHGRRPHPSGYYLTMLLTNPVKGALYMGFLALIGRLAWR